MMKLLNCYRRKELIQIFLDPKIIKNYNNYIFFYFKMFYFKLLLFFI